MKYSEKLKDPRWQKKRLEIFNRDNFSCQICGDTESTLVVHHYKYSGEPWESDEKYLMTLCENCHESEHKNLKENKELLNNSIAGLDSIRYKQISNIINSVINNSRYPIDVSFTILEKLLSDKDFFNDVIVDFYFKKINKKVN